MKYLGILIDSHLNWKFHVDDLSIKLFCTVGMLAKIRHCVNQRTLNMIYHDIFSFLSLRISNMGQRNTSISKMEKLQNKALVNPLYSKCEILKFADNIKLSNFLFAHDSIKSNLPTSLCDSITLSVLHVWLI